MYRTFRTMKAFNFTVVLVAVALLVCFLVYLLEFMFYFNPEWKWYGIVAQTFFFVLMYWAFVQVYLIEPGSVPQFYAVEAKSYDAKDERRYCLICHNFKPQRTHHCSACNKCILNMDHHCPWINNCIGFHNRKFFILFLLYLAINLFLVSAQSGYLLTMQMIPIFNHQASTTIHTAIRIMFFVMMFGLLFPIVTFTAYHYSLVFCNETTLTELKKERDAERQLPPEYNVYDVGEYRNFTQVFGKRWWQWFLPITGTLVCDGLNWPKNTYAY